MKTYVVMMGIEEKPVVTESDNNFKIKQLKKKGYQIIGRVKVHNGFKVLSVNLK